MRLRGRVRKRVPRTTTTSRSSSSNASSNTTITTIVNGARSDTSSILSSILSGGGGRRIAIENVPDVAPGEVFAGGLLAAKDGRYLGHQRLRLERLTASSAVAHIEHGHEDLLAVRHGRHADAAQAAQTQVGNDHFDIVADGFDGERALDEQERGLGDCGGEYLIRLDVELLRATQALDVGRAQDLVHGEHVAGGFGAYVPRRAGFLLEKGAVHADALHAEQAVDHVVLPYDCFTVREEPLAGFGLEVPRKVGDHVFQLVVDRLDVVVGREELGVVDEKFPKYDKDLCAEDIGACIGRLLQRSRSDRRLCGVGIVAIKGEGYFGDRSVYQRCPCEANRLIAVPVSNDQRFKKTGTK